MTRTTENGWRVSAVLWGAALASSCNHLSTSYQPIGEIDSSVDVAHGSAPDAATCVDRDHDGFGDGCASGPDCDDDDSLVTDACYRCQQAATGCACSSPGARQLCDVVTDSTIVAPGSGCHLGERTCVNGRWSVCQAFASHARTILPPSSCMNVCDPTCQSTTVCFTGANDLGSATTTVSGVVISSLGGSALCGSGPPGGVQLPNTIVTGGSVGSGTCAAGSMCGAWCCGSTQSCVSTTTGTAVSGCTSGSSVGTTMQICSLNCAAGTTHCGNAPFDQCCAAGQVCHSGACMIDNPSGCHSNGDCPLADQSCLGFRVCNSPTGNATCACTSVPNSGCLTSARAHGFQEIDDVFRTNSGLDARQIRFAHYLRGFESSPTSAAPCTSSNDCPFGRSNAAPASDPYPCPGCTPTSASAFAGFASSRAFDVTSAFVNTLDWRYLDFVRYDTAGTIDAAGSNEYPWSGLIFDLGQPSNQVAIFGARHSAADCCVQGMEFQVWLTDNPGATTIASSGTPDPMQWNRADWYRVYTEGWTRNPTSTGARGDTTNLDDASAGNAIADAWVSIWTLPDGCHGFRYAAVQVGNTGSPSNSCHMNATSERIDAVAGLDANGDTPSIVHVLPLGATAGPDPLVAIASVQSADIYFLVDTNMSMSPVLTNLQSAISTSGGVGCAVASGGVVGAARCVVPDAWFGAGSFSDFAIAPYGVSPFDRPFANALDINGSAASIQSAVQGLTIARGGDSPASDVPALWAIATGNGIGSLLAPRTGCPAGSFGYPCFRAGALPLIVLLTDSIFHNGPGDTNLYDDAMLGTASPRFAATVTALNAIGAHVAVIEACDGRAFCAPDALTHANAIATQTATYRDTASTPAVYTVPGTGAGTATTTATAISDVIQSLRLDIDAVALDDPSTSAVDERCFVANPAGTAPGTLRLSSTSLGEPPPFAAGQCASIVSTGTGVGYLARQCQHGTPVAFRADFANHCVAQTGVDQVFHFDIEYRGNGVYDLGRVPVTIIVPRASYPASGTYTYIVDSTGVCGAGELPVWQSVYSEATVPAGTRIQLDVRSAATLANLPAATWVSLGSITTSTSSLPLGATINQTLQAAGVTYSLPFLQVRFTLYSDSTQTLTPVLLAYQVQFSCAPGL